MIGRFRLKRTDKNQLEIVRFLSESGCQIINLTQVGQGCPDLLICYNGINILIEIKNTGKLNDKQRLFHHKWNGPIEIVYNLEQTKTLLQKYHDINKTD